MYSNLSRATGAHLLLLASGGQLAALEGVRLSLPALHARAQLFAVLLVQVPCRKA